MAAPKRRLNLRFKLAVALLVVMALTAMAGLVGIDGARRTSAAFGRIIQVTAPRIQALLEMKAAVNRIQAETLAFAMLGDAKTELETSTASQQKYRLLAAIDRMGRWQGAYHALAPAADSGKQAFVDELQTLQRKIIAKASLFAELKEKSAGAPATDQQLKELQLLQQALRDRIDGMVDKETEELADLQEATYASTATITRGVMMIAGVTFVGVLGIGLVLMSMVSALNRELATRARLAEEFQRQASTLQQQMQERLKMEAERNAAMEAFQHEQNETQKMNQFMMNREERIMELKQEINDLLKALDCEPKYWRA